MDGMKKALERLSGWKYVLLVAAVGLALLLMPSGSGALAEPDSEEARLEALLEQIEGVGEVRVLLSEQGAVVVCQGADNAIVRLGVCQVLRCYAGLGADRVEIFKMKGS